MRYVDPSGHSPVIGALYGLKKKVEDAGNAVNDYVIRPAIRGAASVPATAKTIASEAYGALRLAMGMDWDGFGENVVEAGRDPGRALTEAREGFGRHVNKQLDIAHERIAQGDDAGAAFGFTEEVTAPTAVTVVTVVEGVGGLGKATLKRAGPSLDRMKVALREAAEAQQQQAELAQARAIASGRRGELGAAGGIMGDAEARAILSGDGSKTVPLNKILYTMEDAPTPPMQGSRQTAINRAWAQEVQLIQETGRGTRPWAEAEIKEILAGASYKDLGYTGHHLNRVADAPAWRGDPRNIEFLKQGPKQEHMRRGHPGGTAAAQPPKYLIDREAMLESLGGGVVDAPPR